MSILIIFSVCLCVFLLHFSYFFRAVVRELIETEEEFGRDLMRVVDKYIKTVENSKPPKIITDNKDLIFGNFKQITEFHNTLVNTNSFDFISFILYLFFCTEFRRYLRTAHAQNFYAFSVKCQCQFACSFCLFVRSFRCFNVDF